MKSISVKLPAPLASWLSRRARELGRNQSDLVREALEQQRRGSAEPSCHDLMHDLCGTLEGPADLSTHRRHLEGFGQ